VNSRFFRGGVVGAIAATALLASCTQVDEATQIDFDALLQGTSAYQREILQDRVVDADEYEKAVLATWDCLQAEGFEPDEPRWTHGQLIFDTALEAPDEAALEEMNERLDLAYTTCEAEYVDSVAQAWAFQLVLSPDEREKVRPNVIECLGRAGISVPSDASDEELFEKLVPDNTDQWSDCAEEYPGYFSYIPDNQ
jgi:hypothetical protein